MKIEFNKAGEYPTAMWFIEVLGDWRIMVFGLHPTDWRVEYLNEWYDGPHKSIWFGPFTIYWNW